MEINITLHVFNRIVHYTGVSRIIQTAECTSDTIFHFSFKHFIQVSKSRHIAKQCVQLIRESPAQSARNVVLTAILTESQQTVCQVIDRTLTQGIRSIFQQHRHLARSMQSIDIICISPNSIMMIPGEVRFHKTIPRRIQFQVLFKRTTKIFQVIFTRQLIIRQTSQRHQTVVIDGTNSVRTASVVFHCCSPYLIIIIQTFHIIRHHTGSPLHIIAHYLPLPATLKLFTHQYICIKITGKPQVRSGSGKLQCTVRYKPSLFQIII